MDNHPRRNKLVPIRHRHSIPGNYPQMSPPFLNHSSQTPPPYFHNLDSIEPFDNEYYPNPDSTNYDDAFFRREGGRSQHPGTQHVNPRLGNDVLPEPGDDVVEVSGSNQKKGKGKAKAIVWSADDDIVLVGAWFHHSVDPKKGTSQKSTEFWDKISAEFNQFRAPAMRSKEACKSRWNKIAPRIAKYIGCEKRANSHYQGVRSGGGPDDVTKLAMQFFVDEEPNTGESSTSAPSIPRLRSEFLPDFNLFGANFPAMVNHYKQLAEEAHASEQTPNPPKKKRNPINRDRVAAQNAIQRGYFNQPPERTYTDKQFRLRYRMQRPLFQRLVDELSNYDPFFQQKPDACDKLGFSPIHKSDQQDETFQIGSTTTITTIKHFVKGIIRVFGANYLRPTSPDDIERLKHAGRRRGFPGMIGSIDCMHWQWQNCPTALKGQYQGRSGKATVILEAVASYDTFIWHAFFGMAGSNNDINVLQRSDLFDDMCEGRVPTVTYEVNGNRYNHGYYLTDGIYPKWAAFIPAYISPNYEKRKVFTRRQEGLRKDVGRAFGILQARFVVIRRPAKYWSINMLRRIMIACIILHNMIVEDERDTYGFTVKPGDYEQIDPTITWHYDAGHRADLDKYRQTWGEIRNKDLHERLLHDLTEHVYGHESSA